MVSRPRTQIDRRSPFPLSLGLCLGALRVLGGDISVRVSQCDQLPQPAIRHHDVIIEHDQVLAARGPQSLVDRGREPSTCGIGDDGDRPGRGNPHALQVRGRLIGRAIVDDDQLPRLPGVSPERGDARPYKFKMPIRWNRRARRKRRIRKLLSLLLLQYMADRAMAAA